METSLLKPLMLLNDNNLGDPVPETVKHINTLTASAILGQTRLPLLNLKPQIPSFRKQSAFTA